MNKFTTNESTSKKILHKRSEQKKYFYIALLGSDFDIVITVWLWSSNDDSNLAEIQEISFGESNNYRGVNFAQFVLFLINPTIYIYSFV